MIAILRNSAPDEAVDQLVSWIQSKGLQTDVSRGENEIVITANWGYSAYDCIYIEKIQEN